MNIIPRQFSVEFPTSGLGSPRVHASRHIFTLGDPFKKTVTSLADPLFPSGQSCCAFPNFIRNGLCFEAFLGLMNRFQNNGVTISFPCLSPRFSEPSVLF